MKTIIILFLLVGCGARGTRENKTASQFSSITPYSQFDQVSTLDLNELKDLPQQVDLKEKMTSVKDQDERGTCSYFAALALFESAVKIKMGTEVNFSEEYLSNMMKKNHSFEQAEYGSINENIFTIIKKKIGLLPESLWPYQPRWFGRKEQCLKFKASDKEAPSECFSHETPPQEVIDKKISSDYFKFEEFVPSTTNELIRDLAINGIPLAINLPLHPKGPRLTGEIVFNSELMNECVNDKNLCGLHSVVIMGYDLEKKLFTFKNSWGEKWGNLGYGHVSLEVVDRFAKQEFLKVKMVKSVELEKEKFVESKLDFTTKILKNEDGAIEINVSLNETSHNKNPLIIESKLVENVSPQNSILNDQSFVLYFFEIDENKISQINMVNDEIYLFAPNLSAQEAKLKFSENQFQHKSIQNLLKSKDRKALIRTSIYQFTDRGSRLIKHLYDSLPANF